MKRKLVLILVALMLCLLLVGAARAVGVSMPAAGTTDDFTISWWTVDGGGGRSQGGVYVVTGTVGQPDANHSCGGGFQVSSGFWTGDCLYRLYSPLIRR